jgi:hypothetical protein
VSFKNSPITILCRRITRALISVLRGKKGEEVKLEEKEEEEDRDLEGT